MSEECREHATRVLLPRRQVQQVQDDRARRQDLSDDAWSDRRQVAAKVRKEYVEGALAAAPEHIRPAWSTMTMSVDWFLYERCAVVANGRAFHESVLASPAEMPKDMEFEALLSVAPSAYERKTGREFEHISPVSYETFSNRAGWHGRREAGPADVAYNLASLRLP